MTKKTVSKVAQIAKKSAVLSRSDAAESSKPANVAEDVPKRPKTAFSSAADGYIAAAQSHSTKIAYASDIRHFLANGGSIPATTGQVSDYLAQFAENLSVFTLERRLIAIHQAHVEISAPSPALQSVVKRTMQGIRRTLGTKQRQVQPMIRDDLLEILVMADQQKPVKAARDRALLLIGFAGAFRRSELIAIQVRDLSYLPNGVEIFLNQSKTDQEKQGRTVFIPHALGSRCPVRALVQWLELAEITEGYVFRAVTRHDRISSQGLSAQSVALVVKASVAQVGGDKSKVSGHSLRSGYCTQASIAGLQPWQIREQTGHKSDVTLAKYIRPVARRKIPSLL